MFGSFTNLFWLIPKTTNTFIRTTLESGIVSRTIHLTSVSESKLNRKSLRDLRNTKGVKKAVDGTEMIDMPIESCYPDERTQETLFDGIPFKYLPIFNIKACKNNTIINVTDYKGKPLIIKSCGTQGFKTAKKGTNVAAQTTGFAISQEAFKKGIITARVQVQGLGPGRLSALKGLQTGGTNIISITDNTPISFCPPRPRKRRRL